MDTLQTIKDLAAKQFGVETAQIDETVPLEKLGVDSLGFLEFLFELEDAFKIAIPQEATANVKTLGELAAVIDDLAARNPAVSG